jgi:hypothetical protein
VLFKLALLKERKMNTEDIRTRNVIYIEDIALKYNLKFSFEKLEAMNTVYINFEDDWGFRVFATIIEKTPVDVFDEDGDIRGAKMISKTKKFNIYNFLKKRIDKKRTQDEIYEVREDFIRFILYLNQLKTIKELEEDESVAADANKFAKVSLLRSLKLS